MSYRVEVESRAAKQIGSLQLSHQERVMRTLEALSEDPRPHGCARLKGRAAYAWRVRVGDYRILYRIDDSSLLVRVYGVLRRDEAYKG